MESAAIKAQREAFSTHYEGVTTSQASFSRSEVVNLARESADFLASLVMPLQYIYSFPPLLLTVWQLFLNALKKSEQPNPTPKEKFPQIALGWPRGHLKTTLIKLLAIYCIIFTQKKFILVVASNVSKANNIVADIMDMLGEENVINVWGNWKLHIEKDTENLKKFTFNGKTVILAAIGSGGDPRGLNIKNERPDIILMDDIQGREASASPVESRKLLEWMNSTLKKAKSQHGCVNVFVGNMFSSPGCILKRLKDNPEWISVIVAGIIVGEDGKSEALWPELRSKEELLQELKEDIAMGVPEVFFSEIMNDQEASITSVFDITKVPIAPFTDSTHVKSGSFIIIDVAGKEVTSDDTTIIYYEYIEGLTVAKKLISGIFTPGDTIRKALMLALEMECYLICVENVGYQASLLWWFQQICDQHGIEGIQFLPLEAKNRSKNYRIIEMFKTLIGSQGSPDSPGTPEGKPTLYLAEELKQKVFWEIAQFRKERRNNTDNILDNLAYVEDVIQDYLPIMLSPLAVESRVFDEAKVLENNSCF